MTPARDPAGTIEEALTHAGRLLEGDASLAEAQAVEILKVAPDHPSAILILGAARRPAGTPTGAIEPLQRLVALQPHSAAAHVELGLAFADSGRHEPALAVLQRAVALKPDLPDVWRAIGDQLTILGDRAGADRAYAQHIKSSTQDPRLMAEEEALCGNDIPRAELLLKEHLK